MVSGLSKKTVCGAEPRAYRDFDLAKHKRGKEIPILRAIRSPYTWLGIGSTAMTTMAFNASAYLTTVPNVPPDIVATITNDIGQATGALLAIRVGWIAHRCLSEYPDCIDTSGNKGDDRKTEMYAEQLRKGSRIFLPLSVFCAATVGAMKFMSWSFARKSLTEAGILQQAAKAHDLPFDMVAHMFSSLAVAMFAIAAVSALTSHQLQGRRWNVASPAANLREEPPQDPPDAATQLQGQATSLAL